MRQIGINFFNSKLNFKELFQDCKKWMIPWVYTTAEIFQLPKFLIEKKRSKCKVSVLFKVFCNDIYLKENPEQFSITNKGNKACFEYYQFVCPSNIEFFEYKKKKLKEILKNSEIDMIALDFIRFYVLWEWVYPDMDFLEIEHGCYCPNCLKDFEEYLKKPLEKKDPRWILENVLEQWMEWKCNKIKKTVVELTYIIRDCRPDLKIQLKTVPWLTSNFNNGIRTIVGQDLKKLSIYIDEFITMTYPFMNNHPIIQINEIATEVYNLTKKKLITSIQIDNIYRKEEISNELFLQMLQLGLQIPSRGIVLLMYEKLKKNSEKQQIFQDYLNKIEIM